MDCSITKRKGCNYCLRGKNIFNGLQGQISICDEDKIIQAILGDEFEGMYEAKTNINYCPMCGREL